MTKEGRFYEVLRNRRSVRRYQDLDVPREVLEKVLGAATLAPSPGNRQDWEFAVITSADTIEKMARTVQKHWDDLLANSDACLSVPSKRKLDMVSTRDIEVDFVDTHGLMKDLKA